MRDLEQFRITIRKYYRRHFNSDGQRYTQRDLASEIGLHEDELGKRLNGYYDRKQDRRWELSGEDVLTIVRALAKWEAISWEQARELLELMEYPLGSSQWQEELKGYISPPIAFAPPWSIHSHHIDQQQKEERQARLQAIIQADPSNLLRNRLESFVGRQAELGEIR